MGNITTLTVFVVMLNLLMMFSSIGMGEANPGGVSCWSLEGSIINNAQTRSGNFSINLDPADELPTSQSDQVSGESGIFTDIFNKILEWAKSTPGIKYIYGVVAAPYNVLGCMGLPGEFVAGIGTLWYIISLLVLVSYLWGRE